MAHAEQSMQSMLPPGPQTPGGRSHHARTVSFHSDKSGGSRTKEDQESPREKARRDSIWKTTSKANPNAALNEAQPGVNAVLEESTLTSLRGYQYRDASGQVITDPDRSNPTRPRLERPLDTIRSFEAAIDHGYKRRSSYARTESYENGANGYNASRRNSGYGFDTAPPNRFGGGGGYYGSRMNPGMQQGVPPQQRFGGMSREQSEPHMGQRPYPHHGHQQSQDTVNTGVTHGSDSTGPWANSTDPSSENSSIDKNYQPNGYQQNGYGQQHGFGGIPEEGGSYPQNGNHGRAPPVQPPNGQRRPIPLGGSSGGPPSAVPGGQLPSMKRPEPEKRKSWLKRRFSKKE